MKAVVTGSRGTVGSALVSALRAAGHEVVPWDRSKVPVDEYAAIHGFLETERPDIVYHLGIASQPTFGVADEGWRVNWLWPSEVAWATRQLDIRMVLSSTAMVFTEHAQGPFTTAMTPDASDGYAGEKRRAEVRVQYQNPKAIIARLGWQIGEAPGSNNMVDYLENHHRDHGEVRASTRWLPACAFLDETARALVALATMPSGVYHLDQNRRWSFFEIASALAARHGGRWKVTATDDFVYDQRLIEQRLELPPLSTRLTLPEGGEPLRAHR